MRCRIAWLLVPCLLLLGIACRHDADVFGSPLPIPAGALTYAGYDENGVRVVEGWVRLDVATTEVTGTWMLRRVAITGDIGPQIGSGRLEGSLQSGRLIVDLNPGVADDNVTAEGVLQVLHGPAHDLRWSGTWRWSTLQGIRRTGTFMASR